MLTAQSCPQYKLAQRIWLCRTHLDNFLVDFGLYWTISDPFGPSVYLDLSIWTCLFGPVFFDLSI